MALHNSVTRTVRDTTRYVPLCARAIYQKSKRRYYREKSAG